MRRPMQRMTIAISCVGLSACVAVAPVVLGSLMPYPGDAKRREDAILCRKLQSAGIVAVESLDAPGSTDGGQVGAFQPAYWRTETDIADPPTQATLGQLVVTQESALFLAARGAGSVRIPLSAVISVNFQRWQATGVPRAVVVESCGKRRDIFTFAEQEDLTKPDATATEAAAELLKARAGVARTAALDVMELR